MDSLKKFIKEHTLGFIFIVFCIIMLVIGIKIAFMFLSGKGGNKYGDRLKDIEKYSIDDKVKTKLESELSSLDNVESVSYRLSGKIINVIFGVKPEMDKNTAKEDASKVLSYFDTDELGYYDVQVYVKCDKCTPGEDGTSIYPIIGYKKNTSESLVWSNN